jgi:hypothetical protein
MALRCMAHAWAERARAVQSHFSGHADRVAPALRRSLEYARQMPKLTGYGGPYRLLVGRHVVILRWTDLCDALQQEMGDCALSRLKDSYFFGRADHYDPPGANVAGDRK